MAAIAFPRVTAPPRYSCQLHHRLPLLRHAASASASMPLLPRLRLSQPPHLLLGFALPRTATRRSGRTLTARASSCVQCSSTFSSVIAAAISAYFAAATALIKSLLRASAVALHTPLGKDDAKALASLKQGLKHSAVLCFAAMSQSPPVSTPLTVVAAGMAKWLELYSGVLMIRVLLSWFPNIPWDRQPLQAIRDMCDPYLNLFRNLIPPIFNALDVSPMLAFLVLGFLASVLNSTMQA